MALTASSLAGHIGTHLAVAPFHTVVDAALSPIGQRMGYLSNSTDPTAVPTVETCLRAWATGWMSDTTTHNICLWQGAQVPVGMTAAEIAALSPWKQQATIAWGNAIASTQAVVTIDGALELWQRGLIVEEQLHDMLLKNAVRDPEVVGWFKELVQAVPEVSDIKPAWLRGLMSDEDAALLLSRRGYNLEVFSGLWLAESHTVSPEDAIQFARRRGFNEPDTRLLLRRSGVSDSFQQEMYATLYEKLPTRSDLTQWLMRNVFDQQYVTDFRLDEGFEDRYWQRFSGIFDALGWSKEFAYLDYAAHWILPAVGQLAEMVQRLRPGRVADNLVFTAADYYRTLAEQDFAPYFRDRLLAISYRPLQLRHIRQAYLNNQITQAEVVEFYRDQGYSQADAVRMAGAEEVAKAQTRARNSRGWTPQALAVAYQTGQISADLVLVNMEGLGFSRQETQLMLQRAAAEFQGRFVRLGLTRASTRALSALVKGYTVGTVTRDAALATMIQMGLQPASADAILRSADLDSRTATATRVIASVKKAYLHGQVTLVQARTLLTRAGLAGERVDQHTAAWQLELTPRRRQISAATLHKGFLQGLLSESQVVEALRNLGYPEPDILLQLAEFTADLAKQSTKLSQSRDKSSAAQAKLYDKLLAGNARLEAKIRAALKRATPPSKLQKWLAKGWISESDFIHRMTQMGFDDAVTAIFLAEAFAKTKPPGTNGTSSPPGAGAQGGNGTVTG